MRASGLPVGMPTAAFSFHERAELPYLVYGRYGNGTTRATDAKGRGSSELPRLWKR